MFYKKDIENDNNKITIQNIKDIMGESKDVIYKEIYINGNKKMYITLIYIEGMVNTKNISDDILKPLIHDSSIKEINSLKKLISYIDDGLIYFPNQKKHTNVYDCLNELISGSAILVFDRENTAFSFEARGFEKRAITEPTGENVQKGAKDVFVETLRDNTATVRRKIKTPKLRLIETVVGKQSKTTVVIVYIEGITNSNLVKEVNKRIDSIHIGEVTAAGHIEEYIVDSKTTMFPQITATERPDRFCSNIFDGRVGLIIDGLPNTYVIPATLNQLLQAGEDYSQNYFISSFIRLLRFFLVFLSLFLPALYVAITSFHQEMIPTELALSIVGSKDGVPFPVFIEVLIMLIAFEVLLEAGLRLPKNIGQAVSIVGALVVGEAAVTAKIISPAVVIVVALTGISGFAMPNQDFSNALRLWRLIIVLSSTIGGLFGLTISGILLLLHLSSLESFGVPFLSPFVTGGNKSFWDTIFRFPMYLNKKRPVELRTINKRKQE